MTSDPGWGRAELGVGAYTAKGELVRANDQGEPAMHIRRRVMRGLRPSTWLAVSAVAALAVAACSSGTNAGLNGSGTSSNSNQTFTIKFTYGAPPPSPTTEAIQAWAKKIESESKGQIKVVTYFNGVLGPNTQQLSLVQSDTAQMTAVNAANLGTVEAGYDFLQLPFIFSSQAQVNKGLASTTVAKLNKTFQAKTGLRILGWQALGFVQLINGVHAITSPVDMKGIKFRVIPGSQPQIQAFDDLAADPVPLDNTETFTSEQQGVVNGDEGPLTVLLAQKDWEVLKYITVLDFQYNPECVIINQKFLKSMPANLQSLVISSVQSEITNQIKIEQSGQAVAEKTLAHDGIHIGTLSKAQREKFIAAVESELKSAYRQYGAGLFKAFAVPAP